MITGTVIEVGQVDGGVSKSGKQWKKQMYVIEVPGKYPKKVAFTLMNEKIDEANIQMGQMIQTEIDVESRPYNGKWYHEVKGWSTKNLGYVQQTNQAPVLQQQAPQGYAPTAQPTNVFGQPAQTSAVPMSGTNDMPF